MKKFGTIGIALIFLGLATAGLRADELIVQAPVSGTYRAGALMDIRWTYQFMEWLPSTPAQKQMVIRVHQYGKQYNGPVPSSGAEDIATLDVDALHYSWRVPDIQTNWDGFVIKIFMKEHDSIMGFSQPFQVERRILSQKIPVAIPLNRTIAVTSPAAGQNCKIGTSVTIAWDKSKITNYGYVWLEICWPNHTSTAGAFPTSNTGSYVWTIHETAENTLCVKVYTQDNKYSGFSGNFNVVK